MSQTAENILPHQAAVKPLEYWNAAISHAGQDLSVQSIYGLRFDVADAPQADRLAMKLTGNGGANAFVVLEEFPFAQSLQVELSVEDVLQLAPDLREALLQGIEGHLRESLPADLQKLQVSHPWQPLSELASPQEQAELSWLNVLYGETGLGQSQLLIGVRPQDLQVLLGDLPLTSKPVWLALRKKMTTRVSLCLAASKLPLRGVRGLAAGDLILLEADVLGQRITVEGPHTRHHLLHVEQGWGCERIERVEDMQDEFEQQNAAAAEQAPASDVQGTGEQTEAEPGLVRANLDDMPVPVRFEIDEREIPVAELESWQAGALVEIDVPALTENLVVHVRAGGKRIAQGSLVQIDNRVALRIAKIL